MELKIEEVKASKVKGAKVHKIEYTKRDKNIEK